MFWKGWMERFDCETHMLSCINARMEILYAIWHYYIIHVTCKFWSIHQPTGLSIFLHSLIWVCSYLSAQMPLVSMLVHCALSAPSVDRSISLSIRAFIHPSIYVESMHSCIYISISLDLWTYLTSILECLDAVGVLSALTDIDRRSREVSAPKGAKEPQNGGQEAPNFIKKRIRSETQNMQVLEGRSKIDFWRPGGGAN